MNDALRALARAAEGAGSLQGPGVRTGRAEHPVCGDELELDLLWQGDRIGDLAWRARGCPATLAVAASLRGAWRDVPITAARSRLVARLAQAGGLAQAEGHAVELAMRALAAAQEASA